MTVSHWEGNNSDQEKHFKIAGVVEPDPRPPPPKKRFLGPHDARTPCDPKSLANGDSLCDLMDKSDSYCGIPCYTRFMRNFGALSFDQELSEYGFVYGSKL